MQEEFSQPVAVLIGEPAEVLELANQHAFRYFTSVEDFQKYVLRDVLAYDEAV